jgi:hypothetical protein
VSYSSDDSPLISNVKVGAINALHTFLVPAGTTATVNETSPVGVHISSVTGVVAVGAGGGGGDLDLREVPEGALVVHKTFDQSTIARCVARFPTESCTRGCH